MLARSFQVTPSPSKTCQRYGRCQWKRAHFSGGKRNCGYDTQTRFKDNKITFVAALSAEEEQADFVPVAGTDGSRTRGGLGSAARGRLSGGSRCFCRCLCRCRLRRCDDEPISVDLAQVCNVLLAEKLEKLFPVDIKMMGPLAGGSEFTVSLQKMLADVKSHAGLVMFAGAVQPLTLVVK